MSTRSRIGYVDQKVNKNVATTCYIHHDGYPSFVGRMLKLYYNDPKKVKELVAGGDMSSIGKFIGEKHDFDKYFNDNEECTYYSRDREEEGCDAVDLDTAKFWGDSWEDYNYLFDMNTYTWWYRGCDSDQWKLLLDDNCGITEEDKEQAEKELAEHASGYKNIDKMLDAFLAKF